MAQHWTELIPIDRYAVAAGGLLHEYDRKIMTLLYQPLIGSTCLSLYMTLWAEVEENRIWSESSTHHYLMTTMGLGLKEIYEARAKLEGMGLLKVFIKKEDDIRSFIYELQPPLSPQQFFLDGMLNIYLFKKVGKTQYARLKRFFSDKAVHSQEGYTEATKSFQDVYMSGHQGLTQYEEHDLQVDAVFMGRDESDGIQISTDTFDFDLLMAGLNESLVPKNALTKKVKLAISNLAFLYDIDVLQMKNVMISALTENNDINIEELRKSARDWYQFQHNDQLPSLLDRTQPAAQRTAQSAPASKEDELILYLETTSPRQLLKDLSGGAEPSKGDLKIIEDVLFQQKLLPAVVNVLIQYVMLKTDMKLTKSYVEKIASHWARKQVKRAKDAMELAKNEHRQYLEWAGGNKTSKRTSKKQPIRSELLPDWFDNDSGDVKTANEGQDEEMEKKKKKMQEALKKLHSGGE
ncbi:replication initiation and membrane attachment family protein [Cytobacillus gottheilii]|uniref:replication initiation and membrane attachment family protein n=1 Tax=Cytobacillus gottheilii TaxID=859144 RepID=UPI003CF66C15